MSAPIANFNFLATGLSVVFEDLSTNTPTAWLWDFGDTGTSTVQNPTHVFTTAGAYKITLTATNAQGSNVFSYKILVSTDPIINVTVEELVQMEIPSGLDITAIELSQLVRKWQIYLQPLVYIPTEISESDMFNQAKWPTLLNVLISKLVIYDIILEKSREAMLAASSVSNSQGGLKSVESGPSKAEWYDSSTFWSVMFRGVDGKGFMGSLTSEICQFAQRQMIYLAGICPQFINPPLFIVGKKKP